MNLIEHLRCEPTFRAFLLVLADNLHWTKIPWGEDLSGGMFTLIISHKRWTPIIDSRSEIHQFAMSVESQVPFLLTVSKIVCQFWVYPVDFESVSYQAYLFSLSQCCACTTDTLYLVCFDNNLHNSSSPRSHCRNTASVMFIAVCLCIAFVRDPRRDL